MGIDHPSLIRDVLQSNHESGRPKEEASGSCSLAGCLFVSLLMLSGAYMQSYANGTIDAFILSFMFLFAGGAGIAVAFPGKKPELRVFLLTYAICIFVGGLAQCYSLNVFGKLQSTIDANTFFRFIKPSPPFMTMADAPKNFNSPLGILIWQQIYKLTWVLGFDFGPYTAVMFNAFVMGITGSITVRTAREIFGDDPWRLRRVGTLFAFCGLFILFGSVLLRDCFTTFFNALVLWGLVRWLCVPTFFNLLKAIVLTGFSVFAMAYLRFESIILFGMFWFLLILIWFIKERLDIARLFVICLALITLIIGSSYLISYFQTAKKFQEVKTEGYTGSAAAATQKESLGMKLVARQPMPIRIVMGSGYLMIFPIPLWGYLQPGLGDYMLIKGYHGIYQVLMLPLCFAGLFLVVQEFFKNQKHSLPLLFVTAYLLMNLMAVVATSLEQRHLAQFMPAMFILAAMPDTREKKSSAMVKRIRIVWFAVVLLVHAAWMMAKGIQI
jgi:hypothetical protein